jgi:hypothetical protein
LAEKRHTHDLKKELHHHSVHTVKTQKQTSELRWVVVFQSIIKIVVQLPPGIAPQFRTHFQRAKKHLRMARAIFESMNEIVVHSLPRELHHSCAHTFDLGVRDDFGSKDAKRCFYF